MPQHWRHRLHYARDQHHANNRLGKERSAAGTGVNDCLFGGIQAQGGVCCDDGPINIVLINNHGDPDLRVEIISMFTPTSASAERTWR